MIYRLGTRVSGDRRVARTASLLLLTCIPFLLHSRQARYYPIAMFATMWSIHAYVGMLERKRGSTWQIIVAIVVLFHSKLRTVRPARRLARAARARLRLEEGHGPWQVLAVPLGIGLLTLPWAYYADTTRTAARFDLTPYFYNLYHYLHAINRWAMPFVLVAAFVVLRPLGWRSRWLRIGNIGVTASAWAGIVSVTFLSVNVGLFTRYIIHVVPLFVLLSACFGRLVR